MDLLLHYILDENGEPTPEPDVRKFSIWFSNFDNRILQRTITKTGETVSTVFLGFDHAWGGGPPILWETMIYDKDGRFRENQWRFASRESALRHHYLVVDAINSKRPLPE